MSNLIPSKSYRPTQFVVWNTTRGLWQFQSTSTLNLTKIQGGAAYSKINYDFGIVDQEQTSAQMVSQIGKAGDYLFISPDGTLSIVDNSMAKYYV